MRIRRDDVVQVIGGKDRGKTGRVIRVEPKRRRVYVEGLNMIKRHTKPRTVKETQRSQQVGGVIEKEGPIDASNVMIVDPETSKPTRVGIDRSPGKRVRVARRSGKQLND